MNQAGKILVVDDSRLVLLLHTNILKNMGFECSSAENGAIAMELCLKNQFSLVLTDINMPKMDGYEFTKKLRSTPGYAKTPVIMISTEQEAQDKARGFAAGANVYIVKPVNAEDLAMQIKILLKE